MPSLSVGLLVLSAVWGLECPLATCGTLQSGLCATKVSDTMLVLNDQPCPYGRACSAQRLYEDWWFQGTTDSQDDYPCWDSTTFHPLSYSEYAGLAVWPCGKREQNKDLKVGSHPKICASDHDCETQDGMIGHCYCTFTSYSNSTITTGICSPDISSSMFSDTWNQCQEDGLLMDEVSGAYYHLYQRVYHVLQAETPCASSLFWEFLETDKLELAMSATDGAVWMLLTSILTL